MAVRKIDGNARKDLVSRISREKRAERKQEKVGEVQKDSRWKPLTMASFSPYLCHCRDVKRGYANVCPAHMITFRLPQSAH